MRRADHTPDDARIFVFGSNLRGIHGAGAARYAHKFLGAELDVGEGPTGRTYALPTCSRPGVQLPISRVEVHVNRFLSYARSMDTQFYVTDVGCGLAGFVSWQIAPLFRHASDNCCLPPGWRP